MIVEGMARARGAIAPQARRRSSPATRAPGYYGRILQPGINGPLDKAKARLSLEVPRPGTRKREDTLLDNRIRPAT